MKRLKEEQAERRLLLKKTEDERMRAAYTKSVTERGSRAYQELQHVPLPIEDTSRVKGVSDTTLREIIRTSSTLQTCSERGILTLCRQVQFVRFPRNTRIMEQGSSGDTMLCLLEGECDVYVGGNRLFRMGVELNKVHGMPPSSAVLGEMAVFTGDKRSATVVAATKVCKMIEISRAVLKEVIPPEVWNDLESMALARKQANEAFLQEQQVRQKKRRNPLLLQLVKNPV
jgi:CRP-like cAMP-binding protein